MKKVRVEFRSSDETGNIYYILGQVRFALYRLCKIAEYDELNAEILNCQSYDEALKLIREKVNLVDLDGKY